MDRERAFVHAYVQTMCENGGKGNASEACRRIGIPPHQAPFEGCELMKREHVKSAVTALHETMLAKYDISSNRILFELAKMAFNGMSKFVRKTADGNLYLDFSEATEDELDAIGEVTVEEYTEGKGENKRDVKRTKVKFLRKETLELLGRHKKLFVDRQSLENPDGTPIVPPVLHIGFVDPKEVPCPSGSASPSTSSSASLPVSPSSQQS